MNETQKQEEKPLNEQIQDRLQQLEMQKKQIEMSYAETLGAINEAKYWLTAISQK